MDSHTFRAAGAELLQLLGGARVEKIYGPHPGVTVFNLFAKGGKFRLVLRHERQHPLLFITGQSTANPPSPPAAVMRLRKYAGGRRLGDGVSDYAGRRLAFPVAAAPGGKAPFLVLDQVRGPSVEFMLPEGFADPPPWPDSAFVESLCGIAFPKEDKDGPWRAYAVLTPLLRETLAALDPLEGLALMADLEDGGGDLFVYGNSDGQAVLYAAWPLPEAVCRRRGLGLDPLFVSGEVAEEARRGVVSALPASLLPDFPVLACVSLVDEARFFEELGRRLHKEEAAPVRKASKKAARLSAKLEQEERRLRAMLALRDDARLIQGVLWRYPADARFPELRVEDGEGRERLISLDPLLSLRANMARMFRQSDRGARGLAVLKERKAAAATGAADLVPAVRETAFALPEPAEGKEAPSAGPRLVEDPKKQIPDVARFISSDGFVLLRGKNAEGNRRLLKEGKGHDVWMHAEDGPSAHLIIRRAHAAEEVPERTLREAAVLVGEKSRHKDDAKAHIMTALLRHVHPVKGGAPGSVRVDAVLSSLSVSLLKEENDADEERGEGESEEGKS